MQHSDDEDLHKLIEEADERFERTWSRLQAEKRRGGAGKGQKRPLLEHEVQRMIASELEKDGFMVIRINSSTQIAESGTRLSSYRVTNINATAGHADLVVYRNGKAWMLEVKRDKRGKKSESQERFASCCRRYGVPYSIVTCADDARNFISSTMDQYP
jgi:hypothetical protein